MLNYGFKSLASQDSNIAKIFKSLHNIQPEDLPNRKEIDGNEMWRAFSSFSPQEYTWSSAVNWNGEWGHLLTFYAPAMSRAGGGFAVWTPYSRKDHSDKTPFVTKYFSWIQCVHEFEHKQLGNCYHGYTCTKCGASYTVDSSG